jgi:hypothetical protein
MSITISMLSYCILKLKIMLKFRCYIFFFLLNPKYPDIEMKKGNQIIRQEKRERGERNERKRPL